MTVAVDSAGAIHVAAALAAGDHSLVYGRCAGSCDEPSSWRIVPIAGGASVQQVPTIALTGDDRPRIVYAAELTPSPGYYYLQCDARCDQGGGWQSARLTDEVPASSVVTRPRMPFAVSGDGAAAFAYDDGFGMYGFLCTARCGATASWKRVTIAQGYFSAEALAFASDGSLQLVGRHTLSDAQTLVWFGCTRRCASQASWAGRDQLWTTHAGQSMALALTAKGGARILVYGDALNTHRGTNVFAFLTCDTKCRDGTGWNPAIAPPFAPDSANVGFALAIDNTGATVVTTLSDEGSVLARCAKDCGGPTGQWQFAPSVSVSDLEARYPPRVPASCLSASWGMYGGPGLAIDPHGTPLVAFTAYIKALGGECGTGSLATTSDSFLFSGP